MVRPRKDGRGIRLKGVFCLEGEIIDIPAYVDIVREWGAKLVVDDAHAIGVPLRRRGGPRLPSSATG
ncbi:MAG: hypothetical protein ACYCX3_04470 [Thermoleophilia bacterium]